MGTLVRVDDHQRRIHQYRLRRASGALPEAAAPALSVEEQIRLAIARGEFDNLPGAGKPIPD
ncbi:hypothetical protein BH09ACT10_BH09ACT10_05460 [soil metagenome]